MAKNEVEENKSSIVAVEKDFNWYKKAAEQGEANAQLIVGVCYDTGEGVEENKEEAFNWYKKAAEQGNADAQINVGGCYYTGEGVEEDKEEAFSWFKKAAEQGDVDAQLIVGSCYDIGEGVEENKEEAFNWYKKAAEQGNAEAQRLVDEWDDKRECEDNYVAKSKDSFPTLDLSTIKKCFRETILESLPEIRNELQKKDKEEKMKAEGIPKVFIIHGHDEAKWRELKEILKERFNLNPIELSEQANQGKTIIEKFEYYAKDCSYAFAIFTPDDIVSNNGKEYFQARPNVIFELGWFYSHLGRSKVCILNKGQKSEIFSDLDGILFVPFQNRILEQLSEIEKELRAAKIIN